MDKQQIVAVTWADIVSKIGEEKCKIETLPIDALFAKCVTYGILYREDDSGIIILTEDSEDDCDYVAIPKGNILDIKFLKMKGGR